LYSKCQHITCLAHEVNDLISNCIKIFLKSPFCIQHLKVFERECRLFWLGRALVYRQLTIIKQYNGLKSVISELNSEDAICITDEQWVFENQV